MDPGGIVVGAVGLLIAGPAVHFVTRAASKGSVEVNAAIGIRTRLTRSSQEAWEAAHQNALPLTRLACVLAVSAAVVSVATAVMADTAVSPVVAVIVTVAGYAAFVVVLLLAVRAANRAARSSC